MKKELEESQKEAAMLTHILADKKAEQQIEVNRNLALERKLEKSQQNEKALKSFVEDFQMSSCSLQEVAQTTESFMEHISLQMDEAFRKLAVFSQRVSFASGRVKFLQGKFNNVVNICSVVRISHSASILSAASSTDFSRNC